MSIEPRPSCKQPPVLLKDMGSKKASIACRQVFLRRHPDETECVEKPALMEFPDTQAQLIKRWNQWVRSKKNA